MTAKAIKYILKAEKQAFNHQKIASSADAVSFARNFYGDDILIYESAFIVLLNSKNDAIGYAKISQGGVCGTVVDPRIILKYAIDTLATGVIFIHNHPSGNIQPSREDIGLTRRIKDALALLSVKLPDSIIITDGGYYSMADEGMI